MDWEGSVRVLLGAAHESPGDGELGRLAQTLAQPDALPCPPGADQEQFFDTFALLAAHHLPNSLSGVSPEQLPNYVKASRNLLRYARHRLQNLPEQRGGKQGPLPSLAAWAKALECLEKASGLASRSEVLFLTAQLESSVLPVHLRGSSQPQTAGADSAETTSVLIYRPVLLHSPEASGLPSQGEFQRQVQQQMKEEGMGEALAEAIESLCLLKSRKELDPERSLVELSGLAGALKLNLWGQTPEALEARVVKAVSAVVSQVASSVFKATPSLPTLTSVHIINLLVHGVSRVARERLSGAPRQELERAERFLVRAWLSEALQTLTQDTAGQSGAPPGVPVWMADAAEDFASEPEPLLLLLQTLGALAGQAVPCDAAYGPQLSDQPQQGKGQLSPSLSQDPSFPASSRRLLELIRSLLRALISKYVSGPSQRRAPSGSFEWTMEAVGVLGEAWEDLARLGGLEWELRELAKGLGSGDVLSAEVEDSLVGALAPGQTAELTLFLLARRLMDAKGRERELKRRGMVTSFGGTKGFGFLTDVPTGKNVYFHRKVLGASQKKLHDRTVGVGEIVEYEVDQEGKVSRVRGPGGMPLLGEPSSRTKKKVGWKGPRTPLEPEEVGPIRQSKHFVPAQAIALVIGPNELHVRAIQEATGAHIEVEKEATKKESAPPDRGISICGSAEATRHAILMIDGLIQDPESTVSAIVDGLRKAPLDRDMAAKYCHRLNTWYSQREDTAAKLEAAQMETFKAQLAALDEAHKLSKDLTNLPADLGKLAKLSSTEEDVTKLTLRHRDLQGRLPPLLIGAFEAGGTGQAGELEQMEQELSGLEKGAAEPTSTMSQLEDLDRQRLPLVDTRTAQLERAMSAADLASEEKTRLRDGLFSGLQKRSFTLRSRLNKLKSKLKERIEAQQKLDAQLTSFEAWLETMESKAEASDLGTLEAEVRAAEAHGDLVETGFGTPAKDAPELQPRLHAASRRLHQLLHRLRRLRDAAKAQAATAQLDADKDDWLIDFSVDIL